MSRAGEPDNPGVMSRSAGWEPDLRQHPPMPSKPSAPGSRRLAALLDALSGPVRRGGVSDDHEVTGITTRAEDVQPGALFVAMPGTSADGHSFLADAARRGAVAGLVERDVGGAPNLPLVRVEDTRRAVAELAAAWHGWPARGLVLVGITGTAGKTSTLALLETILTAAGTPVGTIGSLGLRVRGETLEETSYTTPDPLVLQAELARIAEAGARVVAMEVTSHALVQRRVHGLCYDLGIFTNLLPLEHADYHGSFEEYVAAKSLFFDLLKPGAPLVYNVDDPVTCRLVEGRDIVGVPCGRDRRARVRVVPGPVDATGSSFHLEAHEPIPVVGGDPLAPETLELRLRLLGRSNIANAALAATAALCLGTAPAAIPAALADVPPPRRRMEILHRGRFTILDDTVGHPESVSAVFELVQALEPRRVRLAWAVRGHRGARINRENAEALAVWAKRVPLETLVVTASADTADALNEVEEEEYTAFLEPLRKHGIPHEERGEVAEAVHMVLDAAGEGDLVLLLGAQGMDRGRDVVREWIEARAPDGAYMP